MSLDVLIWATILAVLLYVARWRRTGATLLGLVVALFLVEGCGWLPAWLLHGLQGPYAHRASITWAPRTAIVLLGAGTTHPPRSSVEPTLFANGRINEALVLYKACKASGVDCKLEVSGGDALHTGQPEATVYAAQLERMGVPAADLLLEPRSMNTWENAQFSAPLLRAFGADKVILVSSATHLRRASLYFAHFGIAVTPVRADWLSVRTGWWPTSWAFAMTDLALHEYYGILRYHTYNALGWNVRATKPGSP